MKPKKNLKKLSLKKSTVSNLNDSSMSHVHGGIQVNGDPKPVYPPTYCDNCDESRATACKHSCFYACDTSRQCIGVEEVDPVPVG